MHLGVIWLVVDELVAGWAVPANLERGTAGEVTLGAGRVGVLGPPVREQPERPGEFGTFGGQLVGGPGRPLRVRLGYQQPFPSQPLEALGERIFAAIPGIWPSRSFESLRPAGQRLDHQ